MPEEKIAEVAGENAPTVDNSPASPVEEQKEAVEIKEDIDPRIVNIIGTEKIESAYGEKPEEEAKTTEEEEKKNVALPAGGEEQKENQEKTVETEEVDIPNIPQLEAKPTRLDRRLASRYIRVCHLMGQEKIPTEEEVMADLKNHSKEEKIAALQFHLRKEKQLRGEKLSGDDLDEDDKEAIKDAEREQIRQEILQEEHEKQYAVNFVQFVDTHPELNEEKKEYNPRLAKAVETLFKGGMPIDEAFETVTEQIQAVKEDRIAQEKKDKDAALSGVLSGTGHVPPQGKELGWDDVNKIAQEDPPLYRKMLAEGKFKHLT